MLDHYTKPPQYGYRTKDKPIYFNLRRSRVEDFDRIMMDLDLIEALADPRFADAGRHAVGVGKHATEVRRVWEEAFRNKTAEDMVALIRNNAGEAAWMNDYDGLFSDPQLAALDLIRTETHAKIGRTRRVGEPWKLSSTPDDIRLPPPGLGEHTAETLTRLGYTQKEIGLLQRRQVVYVQDAGTNMG